MTPPNPLGADAKGASALSSFENPWVNALAPPLVVAAAILVERSPLSFFLQGFHVWIHEVGHATVSWLSGRPAIPVPIGWTTTERSQSTILALGFLFGYGTLAVVGWRERRPWPIALGAALLGAQIGMTWFLKEDRARMWMIFAGVGGEFYLAAAMVGLFYLEFPDWFRWGRSRYLVLFVGGASFYESYSLWWRIQRGLEAIPYGSLVNGEDDSNGDMDILHNDYHWSQHQIVTTYWHLGNACIIAVAAVYLFYNLRMNRLFNPILARLMSLGVRSSAQSFLLGLGMLSLGIASAIRGHAEPIPVKVAVVTTFEVGNDTGDTPGEFQFWAEREHWNRKVLVPGLDHPVLMDDAVTIGVVGGTTGRAQSQIMALVMSGMFDFRKTYWVFNGIAGVDPAKASIGSAAWANYVVDGDVAYEIDAKEAASAWPYGIFPIGSMAPNEKPKSEGWEPETMAYELNPRLVAWAYNLTKGVAIPDTPAMAKLRARYKAFPNAQRPPFVLLGDSLGSDRYWYGATMTQWANDWTRLWTDGKGSFAMTDMEDQGYAAAMRRLSRMGRVDFNRILFLRTASDFCMQPPGMDANKGLHGEYVGYISSLEAAYRVGSVVVHRLTDTWAISEGTVPGP